MSTHDPRQMVEDLRNHLAAPDSRLVFLFGAGTSSSVNVATNENQKQLEHKPLIPSIEGLTEASKKTVKEKGPHFKEAWDLLEGQCMQEDRTVNVENILTKIRTKIDAIGDGEKLLGLDGEELKDIEKIICETIGCIVCPSDDKIPKKLPHDCFTNWGKKANRNIPLEIFTTNYDLLFEISFETSRVPIFDGFVGTHQPFFYPESVEDEMLQPNANWIRFWKLHGSVNWHIIEKPTAYRVVRGRPTDSGEMILPSQRKYDQSRKQPYIAYMDRLSRILNKEHSLLITCGYGYGDEHINAILYGALDSNITANVIALQYSNLNKNDEIVEEASKRNNFTVIAPNAGIISGNWGEWQLEQPVDGKTCSFMDVAFDCNAQPEEVSSAAAVPDELKGKMRLGDFNWFCRFLDIIGGVIH